MTKPSAASLARDIEDFAGLMLGDVDFARLPEHNKVIHDAVWGTHAFRPWEVAIIDTPLMQRLRRIKQTSFAYLTYPAANHTRFEHSLGVVVTADRLLDALTANQPFDLRPRPADRARVRLAALLHDCGHVFLSHIGEEQLVGNQEIAAVRRKYRKLQKPKVHEILSHMIVASKTFGEYFKRLQEFYAGAAPELADVKNGEVADYIVGEAHHSRKHFADMINGPIDADKLDYLTRDAYFTGLRISLDIDRLLYTMTIELVDGDWMKKKCEGAHNLGAPRNRLSKACPYRLVVRSTGVNALEQILFAKMQLVATVYHHHKIRAADSMLTSCVEYMTANPDKVDKDEVLSSPRDFLHLTDMDWLSRDHGDEYLNSISRRLRDRDLPKRALVISSRTTVGNYVDEFTRLGSHPQRLSIMAELKKQIIRELDAKCAGHGLLEHDLIVDLPAVPSLREASQTVIRTADGVLAILDEFFPSGGWLETYFSNKWQGHVFCPDGSNGLRLKVAKAARDVFGREEDGLGMKLSEQAFVQARLRPADVEISY